MPFDRILGQRTAVETLTRALRQGQTHHAYRFEGPDGVGKELTAVAFAQALLCVGDDPLGCGRCAACRRAEERSAGEPALPLHPDLILVERGLYPADVIGRSTAEVSEISVQQIRRVVLSRAVYAPHEGRAQLFLVRRAEELSTSAANALLKTLEEPRAGSYFVLLTSQPDRLLPTIRSRSLPVRFGPLPDEVIEQILRQHGAAADLETAVELAAGSASGALLVVDAERNEAQQAFVRDMLAAVAATDLGQAVLLSEAIDADRHRLMALLAALAAHYAREVRSDVRSAPARAERSAHRHAVVRDAIGALQRNASANLTISSLVLRLRAAG